MTFESSLSFFIAVFIFGITPGPGVFAILARSIVSGASRSFMLALGMTISDILYLIAACLGLATIAENWGELFTAIRIIGAFYLLYLAWKMWTAPIDIPNTNVAASEKSKKEAVANFLQGFLISASNPKVILFYIAFLPTFMDLTRLQSHDIVLVSFLSLFALMSGLMLIAIFASKARQLMQSEQASKRLNRSAASIMAGAGLYLLARD